MKKYGDLRDYHNERNLFDNFNIFFKSSFVYEMCFISAKYGFFLPGVLSFLFVPSVITEIANIYIKNNKIDMRSILKERKKIYNEILDSIVLYIKENNISDPNEIMKFLHKTILSGYCSFDENFKEINYPIESLKYASYQIILGNGVCRSVNQFATDIYKKLGMESYNLFCSTAPLVNDLNHMISLVIYNNKYYYIDVFNNLSLDCKNYALYDENELKFLIFNFNNNFIDLAEINESLLEIIFSYYDAETFKKCLISELEDSHNNCDNISTINSNRKIYIKNKKLYSKFFDTYL